MRPRARSLVVVAAVAGAIGALAAGCTDLFHSTADIRSACAIDDATPGCAPDADVDAAPIDFCAWSSVEARDHAAETCARIGACLGPVGGNAFGPCSVQARLAFDCAINPDHAVKGSLHDRWACLAAAQTCDAVRECVAPPNAASLDAASLDAASLDAASLDAAPPDASLPNVACPGPGESVGCAGGGTDWRIACSGDAGPLVEDCSLWAQSCVANDAGAACGPGGTPIDCSVYKTTCSGPQWTIHVCAVDGGAQSGVDCAFSGSGTCNSFPPGDVRWVACIPETTDASAACDASLAIACTGGVAHSCPTGVAETVDCASLLGEADACAGGSVAGGFDWTSGCSLGTACPADSCDGGTLTSCARGAPFTFECGSIGLGACRLLATGEDASGRAACSPL